MNPKIINTTAIMQNTTEIGTNKANNIPIAIAIAQSPIILLIHIKSLPIIFIYFFTFLYSYILKR